MKPIIKEIYNKIVKNGEGGGAFVETIYQLCKEDKRIAVNLPSFQAFLVASCFCQFDHALGVIVDVKENHFRLLYDDLLVFLGESVYSFPSYKNEVATVSGFVSKSKQTFDRSYSSLSRSQPGVYLINSGAAKYKFSTEDSSEDWLTLRVGEKANPSAIVKTLVGWGYESVDRCVASNMVSVRGGILDFYPTHSKEAIRVEFFSNTVDSIRFFDIQTQRSTSSREMVEVSPPPSLASGKKTKPLLEIIQENCESKLYITPKTLGAPASTGASLGFFYESLDFNRLDFTVVKKRIEELSKDFQHLFLFNEINKKAKPLSRARAFSSKISSGFSVPLFGLACTVLPIKKAIVGPAPFSEKKEEQVISSLTELSWGDYLVHQDFGIGVYRGLSLLGDKKSREENIKIEFADGGLVYVPVGRFGRVHKYFNVSDSHPKVSKLGTGAWERQKALAKKNVEEVVVHLVEIHAARSSPRGFKYIKESDLVQQLEDGFPYEETPDQKLAILDIFKDMDRDNPMDRLVYGDVGFGKTEVALRAAMRAVVSGRAVFFLTPTTILSDQHYITCVNRLGALGVEVELLSRFKNKKEQGLIIERLHQNKVDVLIGTHRILSADVPTENLGLLIVDEEHRFGVKHKETIRKLKMRVDVLTLTATPIPRTLQQSLVGIRDTSKIKTPPTDRLPIETQIQHFDWVVVKNLLSSEVERGGQVYFLHNNIEQLPFYLKKIQTLFPKNTIGMAHGNLSSRELEKTILSFFNGTIDILLCTTIIESGLDVQNANTIIINNAQNLGLAQLYQIRGRVGRGERQAFCSLCIPKGLSLMPDAFQRLRAIEHHTALGSGHGVAMKDLEIRGAGNLFGYRQSGQISRIGFELYNKILSEALNKKRGAVVETPKEKLRIVFSGSAFIDDSYMPLVQDRLYFYQKVSNSNKTEDLFAIKEELLDRFGPLTKNIEALFLLTKTQCLLYPYPVSKCTITPSFVLFVLDSEPKKTNPQEFLEALHHEAKQLGAPFRLVSQKSGGLSLSFDVKSVDAGLEFAVAFAHIFSSIVSQVSS